MNTQLVPKNESGLPPILAGRSTPVVRQRVEDFFSSVAGIFESWVTRRASIHTQRAYRADVMSFVRFMGIAWPSEATALFSISVRDVLAFRENLTAKNAAPKTINRQISSISSFCKYLAAAAAEMRLPITVPNPAPAQFISRESTDPREETRALSATRARQLMGLPAGNSVVDFRDRAIVKTFLYSGIRLGTACPALPPGRVPACGLSSANISGCGRHALDCCREYGQPPASQTASATPRDVALQ